MLTLINNEIFKVFALKKIYGFMVVITMFSLLPVLEFAMGAVDFPLNGQNLPLYMLSSFADLIIPIFIIVTLGDLITDEYVGGTIKLSLLHPVSRTKLLTAKLFALIVPVIVLQLFGMIISYTIGTVLFGFGDQLLFNDNVLSTGMGIAATLGSYLVVILPLLAFACMVMFICLRFSSSGLAVATSIGLLVLFSLAGQIVVELQPYLVITYFVELSNYIFFTGDWSKISMAFIIISVYGVTSYIGCIRHFKKKELLY
jgi:ABC-2 type transport system permease protein